MKQLLSILLLLPVVIGFGQNPDEWEKYGDKSYHEKDFYGAAHYYAKGLALDSENIELHWKMAESYRRYNDYEKALKAYASLTRSDREELYPKALFYWSIMLKYNERYLQAADKFEQYRKIYKYEDADLTRKADQEIESCLWAAEHERDSTDTRIKLLPRPVNSYDSELSPWLADDSAFYFASLRYDSLQQKKLGKSKGAFKTRIYKSLIDTGESISLTNPETLNFENKHMGGHYRNEELGLAFLTACNPLCKIYLSERNEQTGEWSDYRSLDAVNQSGYTATQPHAVKTKGKVYLFFASDRARGRGGMDIWYSEKRRGKFARPRNLRSVNTRGNELTPWYDTAREVLYFSSDWHYGYGGYDVFEAAGKPPRLDDPENLKKPVNSAANDLYYKTNNTYLKAHFVSNREGGYAIKGETCCNNIYEADLDSIPTEPPLADVPDTTEEDTLEIPEIPEVTTVTTLTADPVTLYFPNDEPEPRTRKTTTNQTYLDVYRTYSGLAVEYAKQSPGFKSKFFDQHVSGSKQSLERLIKQLDKAADMDYKIYVLMRGFTSPLASESYNIPLSKRRISSVENSLLASDSLRKARENNSLRFIKMPLGQYDAELKDVSDERSNLASAVYGIPAAKSRKVEINRVLIQAPGDSSGIPVMDRYIANLKSGSNQAAFEITNIGNNTLTFQTPELPDGISLSKKMPAIQPGSTHRITFTVNKPVNDVRKIVLRTKEDIEIILFVRQQ